MTETEYAPASEISAPVDPQISGLLKSSKIHYLPNSYTTSDDQSDEEDSAPSWKDLFTLDKKGNVEQTIRNVTLVLENDERLKYRIRYNELTTGIEIDGQLPWRKSTTYASSCWSGSDDSGIRGFLEAEYGLKRRTAIEDALINVSQSTSFHPIREYLSRVSWDGIPRMETLLVDYLGAIDEPYVRAVTRKTLVAAAARIIQPGCKFDYVLVLSGLQGVGKSGLIRTLTHDPAWFSDSLTSLEGKYGMEQLQGKWLIEFGEMFVTNKTKHDAAKAFISKQDDSFRPAYGRKPSIYKRQCTFIGSTNERQFLSDPTGNRRFWPVYVGETKSTGSWVDLAPEIVDQIWAEALVTWQNGEPLFLVPEMEAEANRRQRQASKVVDKAEMVREFLDMPIPHRWSKMNLSEKRDFYDNPSTYALEVMILRKYASVAVIRDEFYKAAHPELKLPSDNDIRGLLRQLPGWRERDKKVNIPGYGSVRGFVRCA